MAGGEAKFKWDPDIPGFMRDLRQSPERLDKDVRKNWRESAARVRDRARSLAAASRPLARFPRTRNNKPQHWKDLVNSIRSGASGTTPYVSVGTSRVPWALGFEFGSMTHRQFPAWTGRGMSAGTFFWPTFRAESSRVRREMFEALEATYKEAFPD